LWHSYVQPRSAGTSSTASNLLHRPVKRSYSSPSSNLTHEAERGRRTLGICERRSYRNRNRCHGHSVHMMINLSAGDQNMRWAGTILYVLIWAALVSCRAVPAGEASSTGGPSQRPDTASDAPLNPNARKMLELATQHLASRLDVDPEEIGRRLHSTEDAGVPHLAWRPR
jgi:hypothetical protein